MPTQTQTYTPAAGGNQLTAEQAEFYNRSMLERLVKELFFMNYGQKKNIPKNSGATTSFRRLNNLNVSTTALTEGVTPDAVNLDISKITATVQQYGNWTKLSDFISLVGFDPLLTEVSQLLGENAGESIDTIVRDIVAAGTNVLYANTKTERNTIAATDKITALDVLRARRNLKRSHVKPIQLPNGGGNGYLCFIHTDVATDLMQTQEWKDANTYVNTKNLTEGMLGKMYGVYFLEADNAPKFAGEGATGADVFGNLFIGRGAYGVPDIQGSSKPEIIVHAAGSAGGADPLNQYSTVAWKAALAAVRLQELAIVRLETGATA